MPMLNICTEANAHFAKQHKNRREVMAYCYEHQDRLKAQWIASGRTNYDVYADEGYTWDCLLSYQCVSGMCLSGADLFFKAYGLPRGRTIDVYNGVGLSTVDAALKGFRMEAMNTNPGQIEFMQTAAKRHGVKPIKVHSEIKDLRAGSFDNVMSFEVLEHFDDPLAHLEDLIRLIKPNGHLIESTGFKSCDHIGHFEYHNINGEQVHHRRAGRLVGQRLREEFQQVAHGFNAKPRIWKKVGRKNVVPTSKAEVFHCTRREMREMGFE